LIGIELIGLLTGRCTVTIVVSLKAYKVLVSQEYAIRFVPRTI